MLAIAVGLGFEVDLFFLVSLGNGLEQRQSSSNSILFQLSAWRLILASAFVPPNILLSFLSSLIFSYLFILPLGEPSIQIS